jgi:hypothetical protein
VYLLGLPAEVAPEATGAVRWRTAAVFDDLAGCAALRPCVLSPLPDLDRHRDLEPLARASAQDQRLLALLRSLRSRATLPFLPLSPRAQDLLRALAEPLRGPPLAA